MEEILYLVIPCYNEEEVLQETAKRLLVKINNMISKEMISKDSKILFVNDGSKDKTWSIIEELHNKDNIFSGINLSRNRGHQNALLAGLMTAKEYADMILEFVGLGSKKDHLAGSLSVIQKKRLEIARALSTKPKLLLLDECMAGLNGAEREAAIDLVKRINKRGISILAIEHVMPVVMGICERVLVLQYGQRIAEGTPEEITKDEKVIAAYLGE